MPTLPRILCRLSFGLAALSVAGPGQARDLEKIDFSTRDGQVTAALAAAAFAAVPAPYNSLLFLERTRDADFNFRNAQIGGGYKPLQDSNFYIEGFIAGQDYQPDFVFGDDGSDFDRDVSWRSVMGTGGVGWSFDLAPGWSFRPTANFTLGQIISNDDVPDPDDPDEQQDFIAGDGVTVGGYGGSLALDYKVRTTVQEIDLRARYTRLNLVPLGDNSDSDSEVDAGTLAFLARLRLPINGWNMFGGPVRSVYEASYANFTGEQGELLDLPWLARVGTGLEFETGLKYRYAPQRVRVMLRYVFGEGFGAFGAGAGLVF
jgi:hypothetical protein